MSEVSVTATVVEEIVTVTVEDGVSTGGEAFQSATAPDPAIHSSWLNTVNGAHYLWYGTPPDGVWVNVSHEQGVADGFTEIGFIGDSITETASEWNTTLFIGAGNNAIYHRARYELANLATINVRHVNAGANQSLSCSVVGDAVTVNLATDSGGVVTSTVTDVAAFLNADTTYKSTGLFASKYGTTDLAQAGAAKYLTPATATTADGFAAWMQLLSGGKFEFIRFNPPTYPALQAGSWTFGKSGLTTASLRTFILPDVLILCAGKTVVEMSGANDILQNVLEATTVTNRCYMWDQMEAAGITVIACEVTPMVEAGTGVDVGDNAKIVSLNAALKLEAASRGIQWIEWPATLFDGDQAEATLWEVDGIHPNPAGCRIMGEHVVAEIASLLPADSFEFPLANSAKWITANPYMTGSGAIATDWSTPTAYPNATVTPTAQTIGGRRWQRLTVAQSGAECKLAVFNLNSQPVTAGDRIRILADLKVSSGFKNVRVKMTFLDGAGGELTAMEAIDDGTQMTYADYTVTLPAHEGPWLSPAELVPFGATSARLSVWAFGAGTVDIGICGVIDTSVVEDLIWPESPADGDLITQNGIQWIYDVTIPAWARYRVAATGGVSSFNDLTDVPAALTTPQAAATASIRKIGTGATDAAAGDHTHPLPTPSDIGAVDADDIPALSESIVSNAVAAVSESGAYVASTGGTMTNGTIGGTLTINSTTITFGTGSAAALRYAMIAAPRDEAGNVTLALTDYGLIIRLTAASGTSTITIPQVSSVNFPVGFVVMFRRAGAGALAFSISGVTVNGNAITSIATGGEFALRHLGSNVWDFV